MNPPVPKRLLMLRPDGYGDILLFEPALRLLKQAWPQTEIAVLIQERYLDITPLLPPGVQWIPIQCDPYRESVGGNPGGLQAARRAIVQFAPDCVVAACFDKTWLGSAVAEFAPDTRHVSVGPHDLDPITTILLQEWALITPSTSYPEVVSVEENSLDWEKNLKLTGYLLGRDVPRELPRVNVPPDVHRAAQDILRKNGLAPGGFVACCPAGTAKVSIKAWAAANYGGTLGWLHHHHRLPALLLGHAKERSLLEETQRAARAAGADPAIWAGKDGEFAMLAGLIQESRMYFGNDTSALHLATALDKPVVAIFGGGHWPRFKPVGRQAVTVVQPLPCFGCGWNCYFGDAPCVKTIGTDVVKEALERVLKSKTARNEEKIAQGGLSAAELEMIERTTQAARRQQSLQLRSPGNHLEPLRRSDLVQLIQQLQFSESDRAARLQVIHQQGAEVGRWQQEARQAHEQAAQGRLWREQLAQEESQRARLQAQLDELQARWAGAESDRAARSDVAREWTAELVKLTEATGQAAGQQLELTSLQEQLAVVTTERDASNARLEETRIQLARHEAAQEATRSDAKALREQLAAATAERDASNTRLEETRIQLARHEAAQEATRSDAKALREQLEQAATERSAIQARVDDLRGQFANSEADRAARLTVIERQGSEIARLYEELRIWLEEIRRVSLRSRELDGQRERLTQELTRCRALEQEQTAKIQQLAAVETQFRALEAEQTRITAALAARTEALEESLRAQDVGRVRIRELQAAMIRMENHRVVRFLKRFGLWDS